MTNRFSSKYILVLIIALAICLRFINLGTIPNGFSDDEAAFGYNAYSILKTGRDEWGRLLPLTTFQSFGDYKLPVYFYLTATSEAVFGLTEFAVRFPTALFGVFSVIATFFLVRRLFDEKTGLLAAFLLAISPFHVFVSRHALESAVPIFFNLTAVIFFLKSFKDKKMIFVSMALFAINLYVYRSTWGFVPVYIVFLLTLFRDELKSNIKNLILALLMFAILSAPIALTAISTSGTSRLRQIGITSQFNMIGTLNDVNTLRGLCENGTPFIVCKIIYNQYLAIATKYISNYISHYSPQLLFVSGSQDGEQMVKGRGFLYFVELPFILIALVFLGKRLKSFESRILLPWALIYPLASASSGYETPGRQAIAMPIWETLAAIGVFVALSFVSKFKLKYLKEVAVLMVTAVLVFEFGKFMIDYFVIYPRTSAQSFRYGYKQLFTFLRLQESNYDQIIISNKIDQSHQYIYQLFFQQIPPAYYLNSTNVGRHFDNSGWVVVSRIGKYNYVTSVPNLNNYSQKSLLVVTKGEVNTSVSPIYEVNYPLGGIVFKVYDVERLLKGV